jgi:hypothetical protein
VNAIHVRGIRVVIFDITAALVGVVRAGIGVDGEINKSISSYRQLFQTQIKMLAGLN